MGIKTDLKTAKASKDLIFQVHGGGFTSCTTKSHELYLRDWAKTTEIPIVSINYSLTPKAPFPRAIEEVFFAYCWVMKNPQLVGWTGENIVFVGDSAGGSINTSCVIKCIEMGIKTPTGLLNIYAPHSLNFSYLPSRFLTLIDPLLSYKTTIRLHKSYAEKKENSISDISNNEFDFEFESSSMLDYLNTSKVLKYFPPTSLVTTNLDPFLDDNVELAKRLKMENVKVTLDILNGIPHAFLNFTKVSPECNNAFDVCTMRIKSLFSSH
jgi:acetyl esterase/lipase